MGKFRVRDLLEIRRELGLSVGLAKRKKQILELMEADEVTLEEAQEAYEEIRHRRERENQAERKRTERHAAEREKRVKIKELEVRISAERSAPTVRESANLKIKDHLQPFKVGEDIACFLEDFKRTCGKEGFSTDVWPEKLLALLPCGVANVVARLSKQDWETYDKVKAALLHKYSLSVESFRPRFRKRELLRGGQSFSGEAVGVAPISIQACLLSQNTEFWESH